MTGDIGRGIRYLRRGAGMLSHPSLRLFVIVPLVINIVIFATLFTVGFGYITVMIDWLMAKLPGWLSFLEWILWPLIVITACLISGYLFTTLALLIASPFNGLLAEKAEELITGKEVDSIEGLGNALMMVPRGILRELVKLLYYLPRAVGVLLLSVIPGINAASPVLWFLLGARMMSITYLDYPMDNHRLGFREVINAARDYRFSSLGFGGAVYLCAGIPVVNLIIVPAAVVGATLLWCEEVGRQQ
jgi:CysZ protein